MQKRKKKQVTGDKIVAKQKSICHKFFFLDYLCVLVDLIQLHYFHFQKAYFFISSQFLVSISLEFSYAILCLHQQLQLPPPKKNKLGDQSIERTLLRCDPF